MTESFMDKIWGSARKSVGGLLKWLAFIAFHRESKRPPSKRKRQHRTRMTMSRGQRLDQARRASRPGSVEKLGFRRSDTRHPCHPKHKEVHHFTGTVKGVPIYADCNCTGVGHTRSALDLPLRPNL